MPFSDYIVFVDESGDHSLTSIDKDFPAFSLAFCVIKKADYTALLVPAVQDFKFRYWGHDTAILHEHEIRKTKGEFAFLRTDRALRDQGSVQTCICCPSGTRPRRSSPVPVMSRNDDAEAFVLGLMEDGEARRAEAALASDPEWARAVGLARDRFLPLDMTAAPAAVPESLWDRVLLSLRMPEPQAANLPSAPSLRRFVPAGIAAAIALAVGVGIGHKLVAKYPTPWSPYKIALHFCLERLLLFLREREQEGRTVHVVFECRGAAEDRELELEFRRIVSGQSQWGWINRRFADMEFQPVFSKKSENSVGLQMADLVARPIAIHTLRPEQPNRAYDILAPKIQYRKTFP